MNFHNHVVGFEIEGVRQTTSFYDEMGDNRPANDIYADIKSLLTAELTARKGTDFSIIFVTGCEGCDTVRSFGSMPFADDLYTEARQQLEQTPDLPADFVINDESVLDQITGLLAGEIYNNAVDYLNGGSSSVDDFLTELLMSILPPELRLMAQIFGPEAVLEMMKDMGDADSPFGFSGEEGMSMSAFPWETDDDIEALLG